MAVGRRLVGDSSGCGCVVLWLQVAAVSLGIVVRRLVIGLRLWCGLQSRATMLVQCLAAAPCLLGASARRGNGIRASVEC